MKLNFLNVLKGQSNPDEMAEQIVALEEKQKFCEKEKNDAKEKAKEIRSRVMCGEKIDSGAIKQADAGLEECNINLDVITESLAKLKAKLEETLTAKRDEETKRIAEDRNAMNRKKDEAVLDLWRAKGRLFGLAYAVYGHPEVTRRKLQEPPSFSPSLGTVEYDAFNAEKEKVIAELKHPTIADVEESVHSRDHWASHFDLEQEIAGLMKKYRLQPVKLADEPVAVTE